MVSKPKWAALFMLVEAVLVTLIKEIDEVAVDMLTAIRESEKITKKMKNRPESEKSN